MRPRGRTRLSGKLEPRQHQLLSRPGIRTGHHDPAGGRVPAARSHAARTALDALTAQATLVRGPAAPWQCLYLLPEPHGHGALRLISSPSKGFSPSAPPGPTSARGEPASEPNSSGPSAEPSKSPEFSSPVRSEAHTSELQSLMRISYAVCF